MTTSESRNSIRTILLVSVMLGIPASASAHSPGWAEAHFRGVFTAKVIAAP